MAGCRATWVQNQLKSVKSTMGSRISYQSGCSPIHRQILLRSGRLAILCFALLLVVPVRATVLLNLSIEELVAQSMLIVEGEVTGSEIVAEGDQIRTLLTLKIDGTIKGAVTGDSIVLGFLGGTAGNITLEVSGQFIPATGESGIFFINDHLSEQVNPLTGWYQGFFPVNVGSDGEALLNLNARPDLLLANAGDDPRVRKLLDLGMSEQQVIARYPEYQRFTVADFKAALAEIIRQQGD
jgi:hypothetical protein